MVTDNIRYTDNIKETIKMLVRNDFSLLSLLFHTGNFHIDEANFNQAYEIFKYDSPLVSNLMENIKPLFSSSKHQTFNLKMAMRIMGIQKAREIITRAFKPPYYNNVKERELYKLICHHSMGTAIFSKLLSSHYNLQEEEMYMLGLMHDIGKLVFYAFMPEDYEEVIQKTRDEFITIKEAEKEYFGLDHCEVGQVVLRAWNYSEDFLITARYHHDLKAVEEPLLHRKVLCIRAANVLCNHCRIGEIKNIRTMRSELFDKNTKRMLKGVKIPLLMVQAMKELKELQTMFGIW